MIIDVSVFFLLQSMLLCASQKTLSPFCEECGATFERATTKFCRQCRIPRWTCPNEPQSTRRLEVPLLESPRRLIELPTTSLTEEATVEPTTGPIEEQDKEDFCGPSARQVVQKHPKPRTPNYNMIFDPPSSHNRGKNKLYGRRCLKHEYPIQHKCYHYKKNSE